MRRKPVYEAELLGKTENDYIKLTHAIIKVTRYISTMLFMIISANFLTNFSKTKKKILKFFLKMKIDFQLKLL